MEIRIRYKVFNNHIISSKSYLAQDKILTVHISKPTFEYKVLDQFGYPVTSGIGSSIDNAKVLAKRDLKGLGAQFSEESRVKLLKLKEKKNES